MRVEIIRDTVVVNMPALEQAGEAAVSEFYRIALSMRSGEISKFEEVAKAQDIKFSSGIDVTPNNSKSATVSIFLDIENDAQAIYFKMTIEPLIGAS